jgi:hypothetical protein
VERWERERILGEWGVHDPDPLEQSGVRRLAEDLEGSPLKGRPLRRRLRNFRPAVDAYVSSQGGPLPYMQRLRVIEAETAEHETRLAAAWQTLADECEGDEFSRRWRAVARRWNFDEVNDLIERHNRWFPVEARLPMDPRTGDYVLVAGRPYRRERLDASWVLARFPAGRSSPPEGSEQETDSGRAEGGLPVRPADAAQAA